MKLNRRARFSTCLSDAVPGKPGPYAASSMSFAAKPMAQSAPWQFSRLPEGTTPTSEKRHLSVGSMRFRQPEHFFRDEAEDELRADRREPRDHHLAKIPLDMKFLRVAHAAEGHDCRLAG